ncbi:MAG: thiamine biosynthesis lipoprotein [Crocinitomix sp.]|jgi:thiamine biosynthesis lipoprotein
MIRILNLVLVLFLAGSIYGQMLSNKDTVLMGSAFSFTGVHSSQEEGDNAIDAAIAEVVRIEALISSWNIDSKTSEINKNAGISPVEVPLELFNLIERSKKISELSNGYFDISFASIDKIWDFKQDSIEIPTAEELKQSVKNINYENIILEREKMTVFLKESEMKIGFGAIGKGYAANQAKNIMLSFGVESGVVNAGGDLISWGEHPEKDMWTIGVVNPLKKNEVAICLDIKETAVVTSGNYEKFVEIDNKKYCHIINPKTGWPCNGLASVTIVCKDAEFADAMATTVFVLGANEGMKLINHLAGVEGVLIDEKGIVFYSNNLKSNAVKN